MALKINKKIAKSISYDSSKKRTLSSVKYIVIHYTGNKGDTAKNNANYFATSNIRQAGAHFFIDSNGEIWKSINLNRAAWAVGGKYSTSNGAGSYYNICTNYNSVSIELCDCLAKPSFKQKIALRRLIKYIQKKCKNANTIIRHWDVNGKDCPITMKGKNNKQWNDLIKFINGTYSYNAKVTKKAAIRSSSKVTTTNKIDSINKGAIVHVDKMVNNWGRLEGKTIDGKYRWITISKIEEV